MFRIATMERFMLSLFIFGALLTMAGVRGQSQKPLGCNAATCVPPACYCATSRIPLDLDAVEVPQMIIFSFNGPMAVEEGEYISDLFTPKRRNPNGSPIRATLFVSDDEGTTDYCTVNNLWAAGHEVASFSVSRRDSRNFWATANQKAWELEIDTMKQYIVGNASIPADDIVGFRSPLLQTGGNVQYRFAVDKGYTYDSSVVLPAKYNEATQPKLWPYTMDAPVSFECYSHPCPEGTFPGFWQVPYQSVTDDYGKPCLYLDNCANAPENQDDIFNMLMRSFNRSYNNNRAPMMVNFLNFKGFFETNEPWALDGVHKFIDEVLSYAADDVYFVTYNDVIEWMKTPVEMRIAKFFPAFNRREREEMPCIERRPPQAAVDGISLLIVEIAACIIGFIVLYVKDKQA